MRWIFVCAILAMSATTDMVAAQDKWPSQPIRLFVPVSPGGGLDLVARLAAQKVSEQISQPMLVVNQSGASGTLAGITVARSDADGHTLLFQSVSGAVAAPLMLQNLQYNPVEDLSAVSLIARFPLVMVISPEVPARDIHEFIALLRANPGKYSYATTGTGTSLYLAAELFKLQAKVDMVHVPYKGTADVMTDLIAGRVAMLIDGLPPQLPYITAGKVRAMAMTSPTRSEVLRDVPAMNELLPGFDMPFWTGVFAPAKTPKHTVDRISAEMTKAMNSPPIVARLKELGSEAIGSSAAELDSYWRDQYQLYSNIVRNGGLNKQ